MTRKDYQLIAAALRTEKQRTADDMTADRIDLATGYARLKGLADITERLADALGNENPRFSYYDFIVAAQPPVK